MKVYTSFEALKLRTTAKKNPKECARDFVLVPNDDNVDGRAGPKL